MQNTAFLETHTEIIKPDLTIGFATLAPIVTAANAHMQHGDIDKVKQLLADACRAIEFATMQMCVLPAKTDYCD